MSELSNKDVLRKDQSYKGAETAWADWEMTFKMHAHVLAAILIVECGLITILSILTSPIAWAKVFRFLFESFAASNFPLGAGRVILKLLFHDIWVIALTLPVWLAYPRFLKYFAARAKKQSEKQYEGGAQLISEDELIADIRAGREVQTINNTSKEGS